MLTIRINQCHPGSWMTEIAKRTGIDADQSGVFHLTPNLGEGTFHHYHLDDGLYLGLKRFYLHEEWTIIKNATDRNKSFYPIIFQYTEKELTHEIDGQLVTTGRNTPNAIYVVPSMQMEAKIHLPAHVPITTIALHITQDWLNRYFSEYRAQEDNHPIRRLFAEEDNHFIYEALTPAIRQVLEEILHCPYPPPLLNLFLKGKVLELTALFFDRLLQRETDPAYRKLNSRDVASIFAARDMLLKNIESPPTISEIARNIGMSESKLKKVFKEAFGYSFYQYILLNRMQKAKRLLDTGHYNVSEVGVALGYSNLAHFARAFRKQFNVSPSSYLASIK